MNTENLYSLFKKCKTLSIDTRNIPKNSIFFGIKGENFNGNEFAANAREAGALYAIVDQKEFEDENNNIFLVSDCTKALQNLANLHRRELEIPILALTGSNGKTTTKELITKVLSKKYKVSATKGNFNNHLGVPLTLLAMNYSDEIGIVEMGANHQKEIESLCTIAEPDFGYITNFGKAHLEGFGGIDGVIKGKSELYEYLLKAEKLAFVNSDDIEQVKRTRELETISFGNSSEAKYQFEYRDHTDGKCPEVIFNSHSFQSELVGKYNISNVAAAIAIGLYFKVPVDSIKNAIEEYTSGENRSQRLSTNKHEIILDAYNANPSSMEEALKNFATMEGKKAVVLGDMFELGEESDFEHQRIGNLAYENEFSSVYLIGSHFDQIQIPNKENIHLFPNRQKAEEFLKLNPIKEKYILIKGSRGMALENLLNLF